MIERIYLKDIDSIKDLVFEQERNTDNGRFRSSYFYRGVSNIAFDLSSSLKRNCGELSKTLEMPLLENYIKYVSIEDPTIDESIWKAMIIGQHHGLPTRLLDWTHSTLIALHFADSEGDMSELDKHDCCVWRIDAKEINTLLPERYRDALDKRHTFIFSVKELAKVVDDIEQYDADMLDKSMVIVEPPSIDQRIVNQYSFFSIIPSGISDLEQFLDDNTQNTRQYIIDKNLRWDLRDILDQLNVNERMVYPGKDGIAKWLARHYYVKR